MRSGYTDVSSPRSWERPICVIITARFGDLSVLAIAPFWVASDVGTRSSPARVGVELNDEAGNPVVKRTVHYVGGLDVRAGHWTHAEPAPHATPSSRADVRHLIFSHIAISPQAPSATRVSPG
jgi:hypothetical protein